MSEASQQSNDDKRLYEVEIGGIGLRLRTSYDQETVDNLVSVVNERFEEALTSTKSGSIQMAAILAALNLAEENLLLKKRANVELDDIQNKAQRILSGLESSRIPKAGIGH